MIDSRKYQGKVLDYWQIFELTGEIGGQKIVHSQEEPAYTNEISLNFSPAVTEKVFVIDDGDHATMMLASDY